MNRPIMVYFSDIRDNCKILKKKNQTNKKQNKTNKKQKQKQNKKSNK